MSHAMYSSPYSPAFNTGLQQSYPFVRCCVPPGVRKLR